MTFSLRIKKSNNNHLKEIVNLNIWQKVSYIDNTTQIEEIYPDLIPLQSSFITIQTSQLFIKRREKKYTIYQADLLNSLGSFIQKKVSEPIYFQFEPDYNSLGNLSAIKNIEFSLDQNFTNVLTNKVFFTDYRFFKVTNADFNFCFLADDGKKYYEKKLKSFPTDYPKNTVYVINHSLIGIHLPPGFYEIDGVNYFFDKNREVMPAHYIFKLTI